MDSSRYDFSQSKEIPTATTPITYDFLLIFFTRELPPAGGGTPIIFTERRNRVCVPILSNLYQPDLRRCFSMNTYRNIAKTNAMITEVMEESRYDFNHSRKMATTIIPEMYNILVIFPPSEFPVAGRGTFALLPRARKWVRDPIWGHSQCKWVQVAHSRKCFIIFVASPNIRKTLIRADTRKYPSFQKWNVTAIPTGK